MGRDRHDSSALGDLLVLCGLFVLASPVLYVVLPVATAVTQHIADSPARSTFFVAGLCGVWCRRFWRRYKQRRLAHDLYYRYGVGEPPEGT